MKKLFNLILNFFIKPKADERKEEIRKKLEDKIATTTSDWVKIRSQVYLEMLDKADGKILDAIEKAIDNM